MPKTMAGGGPVHFDKVPDHCPICHRGMEPVELCASKMAREPGVGGVLEVVYRCTWRDCGRVFIARYLHRANLRSGSPDYLFKEAIPRHFEPPAWPEEVVGVSPLFVRILSQAAEAEVRGLADIAGAGYRKALEFLIKDYCVAQHPESAKKIRRMPLAACIKSYVQDPAITICAERAAWLGNDETHYLRLWEDKDIKDLRKLITLTVNWVHSSLLTKAYGEDMVHPSGADDAPSN